MKHKDTGSARAEPGRAGRGKAGLKNGEPVRNNSRKKVLVAASVASMIDQFNMSNIRLIQEMGYEVHAACNFEEGNTCSKERIRKLKKTLAQMHVFQHQWDCPRSTASILKCARAYAQLSGLVQTYRFAWIHCHSPVGAALARMAVRQKAGVVYTAHGFHFYRGAPVKNWLLYYPAERFLARWTDVLVTVNREDYCFARKHLKAGAVWHIPGIGIDTDRFRPDFHSCGRVRDQGFCSKFGIPQDAYVLLSVGELNRRKNHRMAVTALAALQRPDVYYLVCGQGPLREELQRHADSLGLGRQVRMPGYQDSMPWIYRNADIFIFPSVQEGMPVALMEAMAAGMPCAVSDIRGNRELVRDSERFSCRDYRQLVRILEQMLQDAEYRLACGVHNRRQIGKYRQEAVEARMKRIYGLMERV